MSREVTKSFIARTKREGAGFIIRRSIGSSGDVTSQETDPFLMLDELPPTNYKPGEFVGAPMHPHRGMDTVMYNKQGTMGHKDSMGNQGILRDGDCQWMTAASGIEHDEGTGHPGGMLHGFQMWINLPSAHKMDAPAYNDMSSASIPVTQPAPGVKAKVIAGECKGTKALIQPITPIQYVDFMCEPGATYQHTLPDEMTTCILHVYSGKGVIGETKPTTVSEATCALLGRGSHVKFTAGAEGLKFLLLAGKPIKEPIVWHGPFVMNTQAQIMECFQEYQSGNFIKKKAQYRAL